MNCRRCCLVFLVPVFLSLFLGYQDAPERLGKLGTPRKPRFVRTVGSSEFADPKYYNDFVLTDEHRKDNEVSYRLGRP